MTSRLFFFIQPNLSYFRALLIQQPFQWAKNNFSLEIFYKEPFERKNKKKQKNGPVMSQ